MGGLRYRGAPKKRPQIVGFPMQIVGFPLYTDPNFGNPHVDLGREQVARIMATAGRVRLEAFGNSNSVSCNAKEAQLCQHHHLRGLECGRQGSKVLPGCMFGSRRPWAQNMQARKPAAGPRFNGSQSLCLHLAARQRGQAAGNSHRRRVHTATGQRRLARSCSVRVSTQPQVAHCDAVRRTTLDLHVQPVRFQGLCGHHNLSAEVAHGGMVQLKALLTSARLST